MRDDIHAILLENLGAMQKSIAWLRRSREMCSRIGVKERTTADEFDDFENLVSRYARSLDVILNKVFRSIDAIELEDGGTLLDAVNRAEKRGIVESVKRVRDLMDLRNDIVHEYETDDLQSLFRQTLEATPDLFAIVEKVERYCTRFAGA